jgi:hypothetical protein
MARMIPKEVGEDVRSDAERKLFRRIRESLGNDWTVLHSVGLARHEHKPWSEIDFVLIGPPGVLCLEVKGGRVSRSKGIWCFVDRNGLAVEKTKGPFEQVGESSAALYAYLKERLPDVTRVPLGYGVAFPDIPFEISGPDIEPEIVYDVNDYESAFSKYVERLASFWRKRLHKSGDLNAIDRERIVREMRGNFDFRPSLKVKARDINAELLRLTQEQYDVLDMLAENDRVLVRGGAGTGKTLLAVEEAKRSARSGLRTLYCCFNRLLAFEVRLILEGIAGAQAKTLHSVCHDLICEAGLQSHLPDACEFDLLTKFYPEVAVEALLKLHPNGVYDELVLDETQDLLSPGYVDVLDLLVKNGLGKGRWRAFYDPKQDIFDGGVGRIRNLNVFGPARGTLSVNCRNTQPIAVHTALLSGFPLQETLRVEGPDVEMYYFKDSGEQNKLVCRAVERVLSQHIPPEEIIVLSPKRIESETLRKRLSFKCRMVNLAEGRQNSGAVGVCTIGAFKGLERDVVFLIGLEDIHSAEGAQLLYVGASRARVLLAVFMSADEQKFVAERAKEFGRGLAQKV